MSNLFVVCMGLSTVFFGLICIILLCYIMSYCVQKINKPAIAPTKENQASELSVEEKEELIAVMSAAIAEDLGKDVSAIRILSIKPV